MKSAAVPRRARPVHRLRAALMPRIDGRRIRPETFAFTLVLGLLGALPPLSIDISAPTLLVVKAQMLASDSQIGLVITLFMLGFASGQFASGPLSDRYGRRPVLLLGLVGYTMAAVGCSLSTSIPALLGWRLVQGAGAGTCAVLTFAMIRDLFDGDQARVKRSYITVVFGVAPMLAPLLGAWILSFAGWRPVYLCLAVGGFLLLAAITFGVPESRVVPVDEVRPRLRNAYREVLSNPRFVELVLVNALSFAAIFAYIAGSPLVLMGDLGMSPAEYGQIFACTAAMLTAGAWISGRCALRGIPARRLLWIGLGLGAASAVTLAAVLWRGTAAMPFVVAALMVNLFSRGLTAPNIQHIALEPMREHAGTAAAAVGVVQILSGAMSSGVVAVLVPKLGPLGMVLAMAVLSVLALAAWAAAERRSAD